LSECEEFEEMTVRHVNLQRFMPKILAVLGALAVLSSLGGCGVNSFMDPSRTGRFHFSPTSIGVLDRIDAIEQDESFFSNATPVMPEDLVPSELSYYLYPGDTVTLSIFELYQPGIWSSTTRRIDAGGFYRVSEVGDVRAAGLTPQQFEEEVKRQLEEKVMRNPQVDVVVEAAGGLRYTVYGFVSTPGVFSLTSPDLRLLDALAIAGGIPVTTERVYVIRTVPLTPEQRPTFDPSRTGGTGATRPAPTQPVDVEQLIETLPNAGQRPQNPTTRPADPGASPGMLPDVEQQQPSTRSEPPIDIDALEAPRVETQTPPVDVDQTRPPRPADDGSGDTFIYVEERGEWVRVRGQGNVPAGRPGEAPPDARNIVSERIIEVDYARLQRGDSSQNIVVRPDDRIYVDGPEQGLVYIDGEVNRVGVFSLPISGRLTLSRAITAAGGLGPIAVPARVDLTRKIGGHREATIRLNLAAIRQRTEPDVMLRPDDHVIVGTDFWATPLAVLRNGFRMTYGFGFIFDKNFADEVFDVRVVN
jgi:polysaccharide export outer membrane protein